MAKGKTGRGGHAKGCMCPTCCPRPKGTPGSYRANKTARTPTGYSRGRSLSLQRGTGR